MKLPLPNAGADVEFFRSGPRCRRRSSVVQRCRRSRPGGAICFAGNVHAEEPHIMISTVQHRHVCSRHDAHRPRLDAGWPRRSPSLFAPVVVDVTTTTRCRSGAVEVNPVPQAAPAASPVVHPERPVDGMSPDWQRLVSKRHLFATMDHDNDPAMRWRSRVAVPGDDGAV